MGSVSDLCNDLTAMSFGSQEETTVPMEVEEEKDLAEDAEDCMRLDYTGGIDDRLRGAQVCACVRVFLG
jgi:hypothetical protein